MTSLRRPVALTASTKSRSSQAFIEVRSTGFCPGKTSAGCGRSGPEKDSAATVLSTTGTSKVRAALARPTVALMMAVRSPLPVPKSICGWWSTNSTAQSSGVSRPGPGVTVTSAMLTMGVLRGA